MGKLYNFPLQNFLKEAENMGKGFSRDKFFYGYKAEMVFRETFPGSKKLVNGADFALNDYLIEIGRSRVLESQIIVYYRKIFYNIKHEFKDHDMNPERYLELVKARNNYHLVPRDKFLFVYFTKSLQHFTMFDYAHLLRSKLKRKNDGEYFFDVKGHGLKKTKNLKRILGKKLGYQDDNKVTAEDFGMFMQ